MSIYLDNAATTQIDAEVIEAICKVMEENYGNPSSVHAFGRKARAEIEKAHSSSAHCDGCGHVLLDDCA